MHRASSLLDQIVNLEDKFFSNILLKVLGEKQLTLACHRWRVQNVVKEGLKARFMSRGLRSELDHFVSKITLVVIGEQVASFTILLNASFLSHYDMTRMKNLNYISL